MVSEKREYTKVVKYIKELLESSEISVGDKLPTERVIAETLSISRNSTREALRTLDNMGVIESRQGSGNYLIGDITKNMIDSLNMMLLMKTTSYLEISQLRRYMELSAFDLAYKNHSIFDVNKLDELVKKMHSVTIEDQIKFDKEFHYLILEASDNSLMISIMNALSDVCENFIGYVLSNADETLKKLLAEAHRNICQSFITENKQLGFKAINDHYDIIDKLELIIE